MWIKKSFVLVVNEFWGSNGLSFEEYCWLNWFRFSKEMLSKFYQNPYSCFDYKLSYNHPNEVILIRK